MFCASVVANCRGRKMLNCDSCIMRLETEKYHKQGILPTKPEKVLTFRYWSKRIMVMIEKWYCRYLPTYSLLWDHLCDYFPIPTCVIKQQIILQYFSCISNKYQQSKYVVKYYVGRYQKSLGIQCYNILLLNVYIPISILWRSRHIDSTNVNSVSR